MFRKNKMKKLLKKAIKILKDKDEIDDCLRKKILNLSDEQDKEGLLNGFVLTANMYVDYLKEESNTKFPLNFWINIFFEKKEN